MERKPVTPDRLMTIDQLLPNEDPSMSHVFVRKSMLYTMSLPQLNDHPLALYI